MNINTWARPVALCLEQPECVMRGPAFYLFSNCELINIKYLDNYVDDVLGFICLLL